MCGNYYQWYFAKLILVPVQYIEWKVLRKSKNVILVWKIPRKELNLVSQHYWCRTRLLNTSSNILGIQWWTNSCPSSRNWLKGIKHVMILLKNNKFIIWTWNHSTNVFIFRSLKLSNNKTDLRIIFFTDQSISWRFCRKIKQSKIVCENNKLRVLNQDHIIVIMSDQNLNTGNSDTIQKLNICSYLLD